MQLVEIFMIVGRSQRVSAARERSEYVQFRQRAVGILGAAFAAILKMRLVDHPGADHLRIGELQSLFRRSERCKRRSAG